MVVLAWEAQAEAEVEAGEDLSMVEEADTTMVEVMVAEVRAGGGKLTLQTSTTQTVHGNARHFYDCFYAHELDSFLGCMPSVMPALHSLTP